MLKLALPETSARIERRWNDESRFSYTTEVRARAAASRLALFAGAAIVIGFELAAPLAAHASDHGAAVSPYTMTPERFAASMAALAALIGAVVGGLALARARGRIGRGTGRRGAIAALVLGPLGLIVGGLVVVTADGGLGTGNGLGGGVVAMVIGAIGIALGGLALSRGRRTA